MNGEVKTEDKSGQPRGKDALEEALKIVELSIVKYPLAIPPPLFVQLPTIRDVLREAVAFREVTEGKQVGWFDPGSKRFCYMDVKEHTQAHPTQNPYASYTEPVYVLSK